MLLIWIGHNNVDWRSHVDAFTVQTLVGLTDSFIYRYEIQLRRLLVAALASGKRSSIIVFGLVNFTSFFMARRETEERKTKEGSLFPYLEYDYRYFISLKPEFRDAITQLANRFNRELRVLCEKIGSELAGASVHLMYSDAMSVVTIDKADFLSPIDAWHPSIQGHKILADAACPTVYKEARLLGWN